MVSKTCILVLLFVAALLHTGHAGGDPGPCELEDIRVSSVLTGRRVLNVPQHEVTVENLCSCPQSGVVMSCNLGEVKAVILDTTKIRLLNREDGLCLINSGWPIFNGKPITFTYAAKTPLDFTLYNASPECPA
ncbi:uncharacterized protein LOC125554470 [Triticum urartu]|uniref:uncharacterized protein LOC125554470 n=1 Tax=Triticum urartu TaxID=4572 RepID=UPI0020444D1D|nr:uncharacterized protein LOC125554470 [Triticum urartu]